MQEPEKVLGDLIAQSRNENAWFTPAEVVRAVRAIAGMLNAPDISEWFAKEGIPENTAPPKNVGLVLAGNIPLVGFHDVLCVLATGNRASIKLSSQDKVLLPFLLQQLTKIESGFAGSYTFTDRLTDFDAVIATGSGNSARYFEHYFRSVPHVIRKNRSSLAVLSGQENDAALSRLGHDIFDYYGLGCRNVSKVYAPVDYDFTRFFEALEYYKPVIDHHKYSNNYDYNKSIYLVNGDKHLDNGFLLLKEDERLASPLGVLYKEHYADSEELAQKLQQKADALQCVVSEQQIAGVATVPFGASQSSRLWEYADDVNTIKFLKGI